jgi:prevent-host-death family protein
MCYIHAMADVASRELRNNTRQLLDRVAAGEQITITVDGIPMATLQPIARRQRWMAREEFVNRVLEHQADAALGSELDDLTPDLTDELAW